LAEIGRAAVLNARYLKERLRACTTSLTTGRALHEFVASSASIKKASGSGPSTWPSASSRRDSTADDVLPLIVDEGAHGRADRDGEPQTVEALAQALLAVAAEAEADGERRPVPRPAHHRWAE